MMFIPVILIAAIISAHVLIISLLLC